VIHSEGKIVPQDYAQAAKLFTKAAEKKHTASQTALGNMYAMGQGVPMDIEKATEWQEKASDSVMTGENNTSCTSQKSAINLESCRRVVPHM
jgi:TPR repeat protein